LCAHPCHPSGAEINKEASHGDVVHALGARTERNGEGLNGAREDWCQRMGHADIQTTLHYVQISPQDAGTEAAANASQRGPRLGMDAVCRSAGILNIDTVV